MSELERLLPFITHRVTDRGQTGFIKHVATFELVRFDSDVYLRTVLLRHGAFDLGWLRLDFYMFFNADRTRARPPISALGMAVAEHGPLSSRNPGGVRGDPAVRAELRRFHDVLGWAGAFLFWTTVKPSNPLRPSLPRCWGRLGLFARPDRKSGPEGFDWSAVGSRIVDSLGPIDQILSMAEQVDANRRLRNR